MTASRSMLLLLLWCFGPPPESPAPVREDAAGLWRTGIEEQAAGHHEEAVDRFERAIELAGLQGRAEPRLSLYLASSLLELGRYDDAAEALEASVSLSSELLAHPLLVARTASARGDLDRAYATLVRATRDFPQATAPRLELVALCSQLDLSSSARDWAEQLAGLEPDRETALAVFDLLYADAQAWPVLERLAAQHGDDAEMVGHLAYAYAANERYYAAASLFERATLGGEDLAFEAADQFRMAGDTHAALVMNARVAERRRRLEQRLGILIAAGEMARVVALEPAMREAGLREPRHRYNLAFAHYALGEFAQATDLARGLSNTPYADRGRALLDAMGRGPAPDAH